MTNPLLASIEMFFYQHKGKRLESLALSCAALQEFSFRKIDPGYAVADTASDFVGKGAGSPGKVFSGN